MEPSKTHIGELESWPVEQKNQGDQNKMKQGASKDREDTGEASMEWGEQYIKEYCGE